MTDQAWAALALGVAILGLGVLTWAILWGDRAKGRLRCPKCWYRMEGIEGLRCPECGRIARHENRLTRTRRRWRAGALGLLLVATGAGGAGVMLAQKDLWLRITPSWLLVRIVDEPDYARAQLVLLAAPQQTAIPAGTFITPGAAFTNPPPPTAWPALGPGGGFPGFAAPPPAAPLPKASIAVQLATELALRHLRDELSESTRARLATKNYPALKHLALDDIAGFPEGWVTGGWVQPVFHATDTTPLHPSSPLRLSIDVLEDGHRIASRAPVSTSQAVSAQLAGFFRKPVFGFTPRPGRTYALAITVSDDHGIAYQRTFLIDEKNRGSIADTLDLIDDGAIRALREDVIRIHALDDGERYRLIVREDISPIPLRNVIIEFGDGPLDERHTIRLGPNKNPGWPEFSFHTPAYAQQLPDGTHRWPVRLVNNARLLAGDRSATHCLPLEGIELDFKTLRGP